MYRTCGTYARPLSPLIHVILFAACVNIGSAHAGTSILHAEPGLEHSCIRESVGMINYGDGTCVISGEEDPDWRFRAAGHERWSTDLPMPIVMYRDAYVTASGRYRIRWSTCDHTDKCSIRARAGFATSANAVFLDKTIPVGRGYPTLGGVLDTALETTDGSLCVTLVSDTSPSELRPSGGGIWCQDAQELPTIPPKCTVNGGSVLDVTFGNVDESHVRGTPSTPPDPGNTQTKSINITCERMTKSTVAHFKYDVDASVDGGKAVKTTRPGLGVAITLGGHQVEPNGVYSIASGATVSTSVDIGFQLVRDPSVASVAGGFSASATMILTDE